MASECAIADTGAGLQSGTDGDCHAIDPLNEVVSPNPCFRAVQIGRNKISLQWRVTNSKPTAQIYNDSGRSQYDVGTVPTNCETNPEKICSTTIAVSEGGFYRWQLQVQSPGGRSIYVFTSISIAQLHMPAVISDGGFVDMLAPSSQRILWAPDQRNAPMDEPVDRAWIEVMQTGPLWSPVRLPRFGPRAQFIVLDSSLGEPGGHVFHFRDCVLPSESDSKFCSEPASVGFYVGADRFLNPNPVHIHAPQDLEISFTTRSGDVRRLSSTTLLPMDMADTYLETTAPSYNVDSGLLTRGTHEIELVSCMRQTNSCAPGNKLQILVGAPVAHVAWTLGRPYTEDFFPGVAYPVRGQGEPLDITYDMTGGAWLINEFSATIEHLTPQGDIESLAVPLRRNMLTGNSWDLVKPFASQLWGSVPTSATFTALGERATRAGSMLWFTQGGGLLSPGDVQNHSRIISYNTRGTDSPTTPFDDRFCVYNMPADNSHPSGNNQVIGLTAAGGLIWVAESRGLLNETPSVISSFTPRPDLCENLLDFDDPQALVNQHLQYCRLDEIPENNDCVERHFLDTLAAGIKVAHLVTDPVDQSIWFTDARGKYLGNLNMARTETIKVYSLPDAHSELGWFGGFPWSIRADKEAVYFAEYASRSLLRFDKSTEVFDELRIPATSKQVNVHSIDIDSRAQRLWFTLSNEAPVPVDKKSSTIGYIDLNSWREYVENPTPGELVRGVIYKDLDTISVDGREHSQQHQVFRGIAVDPVSGSIVLATMKRREITELTPRGNFAHR